MKLIKLILILSLFFHSNTLADINIEFEKWKNNFKKIALENNISEETFDTVMANIKFLPNVIKYDRYQPEFYEDTKTYISKRTSSKKVTKGIDFYKKNTNLIFSLVGYTNGGKSSIFNNLTKAEVLVKDMVFATLDTKMSFVNFPEKKQIILTDTVGFISALPTELITAFNASLEELFSADFLLLVHDLSNENVESQANLVIETLFQIGFSELDLETKIIHVFNKQDLNSNTTDIKIKYMDKFIYTSAVEKNGLVGLKQLIVNLLEKNFLNVNFSIPLSNLSINSWLYKNSYVYDNKICQIDLILTITRSLMSYL